ncbi:hypothetical protein KDH_37720 [Dictyobacter sp. S3.2.2.5]|uniref:Transglutaminase-like domain-containing protein n=1 Tax=Dictyobacter halimunensis TaxID=3026934 RepID=A0ABQ6FWM9_9CHLR|nr:hypothetical protein KDH_37720 [Dictyobacter sp. S3.2.2.5]
MRNAAMERLSKLITDPSRRRQDDVNELVSSRGIAYYFEEGWFSLFLLALMVYCVTWCIQAANWVDNLSVLTLTTFIALLLGLWSAKQQRFAPALVYIPVTLLSLAFSYWQMTSFFYEGNAAASWQAIQRGCSQIFSGNFNFDGSIPFLFIVFCSFMLAYCSVLCLYRWHLPWLMVILNALVLVFNLNNVIAPYIILLVIFLLAALVLLLRFNLHQAIHGWQRKGLRYSDDLSWDVMQTGIFITVSILVLSWLLPSSYEESHLAQIWAPNGPLGQFSTIFNSVGSTDNIAANHGNFKDTLVLGGNPNLTQDVVFKVKIDDIQPQYLTLVTYDTYDHGWSIVYNDQKYHIAANTTLSNSTQKTHTVKQTIEVVAAPGEQQPYLVGASDIVQMSLPANVMDGSGGIIAWLGDNNNGLAAGTHYTVISTASSADIVSLREIPMPADAPNFDPNQAPDQLPPVDYFNLQTVKDFTQVPGYLQKDKRIHDLAQKIVTQAKATTMYDKAVALETYLRQHYTYNTNIHPPAGVDPVLWFLFGNKNHDGYCNYFSTAMTLMARSLGIPTREVAGYAPGTYESGQYTIRGVDAHTWTQVYFAGYGWINFEPSASFKTFERPQPDQYSGSAPLPGGNSVTLPSATNKARRDRNIDNPADNGSGGSGANQSQDVFQAQLRIGLGGILVVILLGTLIFAFWWRRLFSRYSVAAQIYGRICTLAEWAGLEHQSSQTPYEYLHSLAGSVLTSKEDEQALERLGDIFVRERWADPDSVEHPRRSGEHRELPAMWKRLRGRLFFYVARHPRFLRRVPDAIRRQYKRLQARRQKRKKMRLEF